MGVREKNNYQARGPQIKMFGNRWSRAGKANFSVDNIEFIGKSMS